MSFLWGGSKPSKLEEIPLYEIKWLQKSLQQGMGNVGLLESNSEALKSAVEAQAYMTQKLLQALRSCNLKNVLTNKGTQTEETCNSEDTGCSGDSGSLERLADEDHLTSYMHHENTESATVLMNQAIVNQKAVQNSTQWLQNLQQQVGTWFSENFESSLNEQEKKYKSLEDGKNRLSKTCKDLEEEKNQLIKTCREHEQEKDQLSKKCRKLKNKQNQLSNKCKELEDENNQLSNKCKKLEDENNQSSNKCKELEDENNQLCKTCKELEDENNQLNKKCKKLEEGKKEIEKLKEDLDRLSRETNVLKNPAMTSSYGSRSCYPSFNAVPQMKQVRTQVYCPSKSDLMTNVTFELSNTLKLQMFSSNLEFLMQTCDKHSQISRSLPVLVICLNASRLGTDVSSALQGVPVGPNVAVLIFHNKDLHALPSQSSDRVLTGPEYKNVGAIIDMAYLTNKGMNSCDMNNRALETLMEFIKTHSHS
ncbi:hypothetical protein ACJMK2_037089 [Sinanodonta woodiana]|uniref:Uncharacterized protein n=1 Tax=Sinanodonta woodiana TaxID=1069815 RepID=A0ABD3WKK0_SINWO